MKITVLYGSARKNGNSAKGAKKILEKVRRQDDEIMEYWLTEQVIKPCIGCLACRKKEMCTRKDDDMVERLYKIVVEQEEY